MSNNLSSRPAAPVEACDYIPGFAGWKLFACVCGVAVLCFGVVLLWRPCGLLISGQSAQAVAMRIVKLKPGQPEVAFDGDARLKEQLASRDDGSVYWSEYEFQPANGHPVRVRQNVGSRMKGLAPLVNADGLRATATVWYHPGAPQAAIFPAEVSTWLAAAILIVIGFACVVINAVLLYWADKPVRMPVLTPLAKSPAESNA